MSFALRGATLIDGTGADPVPNSSVVIESDRITQVGRTHHADHVVDLTGLTLLPGLIDAHTHLGSVPATRFPAGTYSLAEIAAQIFQNCKIALDAGFTTCRDTAGVDGGLARAIELGLIPGPRILPSGPGIVQDGGHGTLIPPWSDCFCPVDHPGLVNAKVVCDSPDAVRSAARKAFRRGATQLKLMASGGVVSLTDELSDTQLTTDEMRAAVLEATARNTYVTIHAHNSDAIRNGVPAGVKCVEHGTYLDEDAAHLMAINKVALVPTFTVMEIIPTKWAEWGLPASVVERVAPVIAAMTESLRLARQAGLEIGSGSDMLGANQSFRGRELVIRARLEDPMTAITSATSVNARILRRADRLGSIRPGLLADVIAVAGDPLSKPDLLEQPEKVTLVIKSGRVVKDTNGVCQHIARG